MRNLSQSREDLSLWYSWSASTISRLIMALRILSCPAIRPMWSKSTAIVLEKGWGRMLFVSTLRALSSREAVSPRRARGEETRGMPLEARQSIITSTRAKFSRRHSSSRQKSCALRTKGDIMVFDKKIAGQLIQNRAIMFDPEKGWRLNTHNRYPDDTAIPRSPFYIDLRAPLRSAPLFRKRMTWYMETLIRKSDISFDCISDAPQAVTPLVVALSNMICIPMISPRLNAKS